MWILGVPVAGSHKIASWRRFKWRAFHAELCQLELCHPCSALIFEPSWHGFAWFAPCQRNPWMPHCLHSRICSLQVTIAINLFLWLFINRVWSFINNTTFHIRYLHRHVISTYTDNYSGSTPCIMTSILTYFGGSHTEVVPSLNHTAILRSCWVDLQCALAWWPRNCFSKMSFTVENN